MKSRGRWAFLEGFAVEQGGRPYLDRLRVFQTPALAVYLHRIHSADNDRGPHDHPWWFASLVLSGGYTERVWDDPSDPVVSRLRPRPRGSLKALKLSQAHAITAVDGVLWTLVVAGPRKDSWRFWVDGEPVDWKDYQVAGEMAGSMPDERTALWGS